MMPRLPAGTVTFLFTDIEGSTRLLRELRDRYVVPPLPFPGPDDALDPAVLQEYPAVRLFLERAQAVNPSFRLEVRMGAAVGEICRRLDGMPLAIELAAPRVRVLSTQQIAERLSDRFQLLTGGSRAALPRQQTLQAAIDWSHELLSDTEKVLFRRLGVFVSGWTLEAVEAVCSAESLRQADILPLLTHLVERSLVVAEEQDGRCATASSRRSASTPETAWSGRGKPKPCAAPTVTTIAASSNRSRASSSAPRSGLWFDRLERDLDNLRAALEWSMLSDPTGEIALNLAWILHWFWEAPAATGAKAGHGSTRDSD